MQFRAKIKKNYDTSTTFNVYITSGMQALRLNNQYPLATENMASYAADLYRTWFLAIQQMQSHYQRQHDAINTATRYSTHRELSATGGRVAKATNSAAVAPPGSKKTAIWSPALDVEKLSMKTNQSASISECDEDEFKPEVKPSSMPTEAAVVVDRKVYCRSLMSDIRQSQSWNQLTSPIFR